MTPQRTRAVAAWVSLFVVALICFLLWREEVFRRGWDGGRWMWYFHWAIPEGVALFILWLAVFSNVQPPVRRGILLVAAVLYAWLVYDWTGRALQYYFGPPGPPLNFMLLLKYGEGWADDWDRYKNSIYWVYPVIPVGAGLIAWGSGVRVTIAKWILCVALFLAAPSLSLKVLDYVRPGAEVDGLHVIKTGCIIPFLVIALGIPFLPFPSRSGTAVTSD